MKRLFLLLFTALLATSLSAGKNPRAGRTKPEQTIFVFGSDIHQKFVRYAAQLTGKPRPKVCYMPTASADSEENIKYWNSICRDLSLEPHVLRVWVDSSSTQTFEQILLSMDAIVVGGGNTLNMLGIWKEQGIDTVLRKGLEKGIVLAGGSAGSLCWFREGASDSRPGGLSTIRGLDFLPQSNCPHYSDSLKKAFYGQCLQEKKIHPGYACDELSGILFKDGKFVKAVSINENNRSYFVSRGKDGKVLEQPLECEILIAPDALPEGSYKTIPVGKSPKDFPETDDLSTPLDAAISVAYLLAKGRMSRYPRYAAAALLPRLEKQTDREPNPALLGFPIDRILVYKDVAAAVKAYKDFYAVQYFYRENGQWMCAGEDIGGDTPLEAEISFREKAATHLGKVGTAPSAAKP